MKRFVLPVIGVLFVLLGFVVGKIVGEDSARKTSERLNYYVLNLNAIGAYSTYADISEQISKKRFDHAKCIADVTASVHFRQIQECLNQSVCRDLVHEEVKKSAPELLVDGKKRFEFYENSERCMFAASPSLGGQKGVELK